MRSVANAQRRLQWPGRVCATDAPAARQSAIRPPVAARRLQFRDVPRGATSRAIRCSRRDAAAPAVATSSSPMRIMRQRRWRARPSSSWPSARSTGPAGERCSSPTCISARRRRSAPAASDSARRDGQRPRAPRGADRAHAGAAPRGAGRLPARRRRTRSGARRRRSGAGATRTRTLAITLVRGNHDERAGDPPPAWGIDGRRRSASRSRRSCSATRRPRRPRATRCAGTCTRACG